MRTKILIAKGNVRIEHNGKPYGSYAASSISVHRSDKAGFVQICSLNDVLFDRPIVDVEVNGTQLTEDNICDLTAELASGGAGGSGGQGSGGAVDTLSVNGGAPLQPDGQKNINIDLSGDSLPFATEGGKTVKAVVDDKVDKVVGKGLSMDDFVDAPQSGTIEQTAKKDGNFTFAAFGQDGKLYFGGLYDTGIWYLGHDGVVKPTNKKDGNFTFGTIGQDGRLYFGCDNVTGGNPLGIWYLDNDGTVKPTNKTDAYFGNAAIGQDGKLYFGSRNGYSGNMSNPNYNNGIWYLDDDGTVKQTDKRTGNFYCCGRGQDGRLYFGGSSNDMFSYGIYYLNDDGSIIRATFENLSNNLFTFGAMGQDGKLYFGSEFNTGLWCLDNDGIIKQVKNVLNCYIFCAAMSQDGRLYFAGTPYRSSVYVNIWYLDNDGVIKPTNKKDGIFTCAAIGQDGKLYFGGYDIVDGIVRGIGIWYLDNDGSIKQAKNTDGDFRYAGLGHGGKLYFFGKDTGIWCLETGLYARKKDSWVDISKDLSEIKKGDADTLSAAKSYTDNKVAQIQLLLTEITKNISIAK